MLEPYFDAVNNSCSNRWQGKVSQVVGHLLESDGPFCSVGECCEVEADGRQFAGEIVGFRGAKVLSMCLERPQGIRYGDRIVAWGQRPVIRIGESLLGRVIDAAGQPIDGLGRYAAGVSKPVDGAAPSPLSRLPIREPLGCGVRAIDGFLTCGRGQRMGIFGGSGVGKSTLIGMMARGTSADMTVLALVGERGREVGEFLEEVGPAGRERSVVVVSTSDQSPLLRIRAALAATTIAEHFCAKGKQVLLVVDSLTRFAMAQREIGLAAGEPPTAKGYTPSVFTLLSRLVERAGRFSHGSITAFYTVLMEGDDEQDPLVDAVRSLLDGHVLLDRELASRGHYPPISILNSLSRLMPATCSDQHRKKAAEVRELLALYVCSEDLIRVGAYQKGSDAELDKAIAMLPRVEDYLRQDASKMAQLGDNIQQLLALGN